jgi:hypothetical protein
VSNISKILSGFLFVGGRFFLCLPTPLQSAHHVDRCVTNRGEKECMLSKRVPCPVAKKIFNPGLEKIPHFQILFLTSKFQNTILNESHFIIMGLLVFNPLWYYGYRKTQYFCWFRKKDRTNQKNIPVKKLLHANF